ncbi:HAMP domain-containing protein [Cohnella sp. CFH 77786]|uniref:HAMP domain-containing sensor histidine kinase n=1 Tax=Cohnella sp. CFH 77786 TaxID=2662265 RepID=UPI001C608957|nr:HAMP domain-containing sensor histidine kinase [Cohnella sp. CFH 77786]MBW5445351.1 HAMP domain-containing protein [Cohnella sp. CFH 77786]
MKLKTYLMTLMLFLLFFNGSIFIFSVVTLKSSMDSLRERSLAEHYFIVSALSKDLFAVENRGTPLQPAMQTLFQSYSKYYAKQNVLLEISKDGQPLYSTVPEEERLTGKSDVPAAGTRTVTMQKSKSKEYIKISGQLPAPYQAYALAYLYDLSEAAASWNRMTTTLFAIGMILSALLAASLLLLLTRIFKPLKQFSMASRSIAKGEYGNRLNVAGHDELAEMAESFNEMAGEIQNQMKQLAAAVEQRQRFIDNLAHELRTPLTSIYGYAEYIQKAPVTDEDKLTATDYIMSESRRLQNIAFRLLELASLRHSEIKREEVVIAELFRSTEATIRLKASMNEVELKWSSKIDKLAGDRDLLESLLLNLTDNAVKACGPGGRVELSAYWEDGKKVISVQDNGKGMTEEQLSHITEAFYRADPSRSRKDGGAGLGLALCEQIAFCHGAELAFSSHPGSGTAVKVTFTTST